MKRIKFLFVTISLILTALIVSSCDVDPNEIFFGKEPRHDCELYSRWEIVTYPTSLLGGVKKRVCDYCEKTLELGTLPNTSKGLEHELREDGVWITGIGECKDVDIIIPKRIDGEDVVGIADDAFGGNSDIVSVVMPDTLKTVGYGAFAFASSLENIIFSRNVSFVGNIAFKECAIQSVYIPGSVGNGLGFGAFAFCPNLKNVVLGEGTERIIGTFKECTSLEFISLPSTLKSIENAFYGSENLNAVNFRGHIGQYCELNKTANYLTAVHNYNTFYGATVLIEGNPVPEQVVIPDGTKKIAFRAFWCMDIKSVTIPDSVTSIGEQAFAHCASLENVEFGKGLEYIGQYAFRGCESLKEIKIHDNIKTIEHGAFQECRSVEYVEIGEGLEILKQSTLECLLNLKTLKLPSTLVKHEYPIFLFNTKLEAVYYGGTVDAWFAFMESSGYSCDDFDYVRVYCSDGEIYNNKVVE